MYGKRKRMLETVALIFLCVLIICFAKASGRGENAVVISEREDGTATMVTGQNYIWIDGSMIGSLIQDYDDGVYYMGIQDEDGKIRQMGERTECSNLIYYKDELYFINADFPDMLQNIRYKGTGMGRIVKMSEEETYEYLTYEDELTDCFYIWNDRIYYQVAQDCGLDDEGKHNIYYYVPEEHYTDDDKKNDIYYHVFSMDLNGEGKKEICGGYNWTADFIINDGYIYVAEGGKGILRYNIESGIEEYLMSYELFKVITKEFRSHEWAITEWVPKGEYLYVVYSDLEEFDYNNREIYCLEIKDSYLKMTEGHTEEDWTWRDEKIQALYRTSLMLEDGRVRQHYGLFDIKTGVGSDAFWMEEQERVYWDTGLSCPWMLNTKEYAIAVAERAIMVDRILQREGDYLYILCSDGVYQYPVTGGEEQKVGILVREDKEWPEKETALRIAECGFEKDDDGQIEKGTQAEGGGCIYFISKHAEDGTAVICREKEGKVEDFAVHTTGGRGEYWRGKLNRYYDCSISNLFYENGYLYYTLTEETTDEKTYDHIYRISENGENMEKLADCQGNYYIWDDKIYYRAGNCYWEMIMDGTGKRVIYQKNGKGKDLFLVDKGCLYLYENLYDCAEILGINLRTGVRKRFSAAW